MYVRSLSIKNIRSIERVRLSFEKLDKPGWHVILGDNGAGKSSVIRALALMFAGGPNVSFTRQDWQQWLRTNESKGEIGLVIERDRKFDEFLERGRQSNSLTVRANLTRSGNDKINPQGVKINFSGSTTPANRTLWSHAPGWFSASFGPFRRFSGGDREWDRLFLSPEYRRAASHLSAFGEDVALTEALGWLQQLHVHSLEAVSGAEQTRDIIIQFINNSGLLPHGSQIHSITSDEVLLQDGEGNKIPVQQMSDGYRSMLSLTFELIRQMFAIYGQETALAQINPETATVNLPGVVAIDEIDAHLHPTWQARVGDWFLERFPLVQFIVTTHSPIICRAAKKGSIWKMPKPGSSGQPEQIKGQDFDRLVSGNILEAFGTEHFGADVERAEDTSEQLNRLAELNKKQAREKISATEELELGRLQATLPTQATAWES